MFLDEGAFDHGDRELTQQGKSSRYLLEAPVTREGMQLFFVQLSCGLKCVDT